MWQPPSWNVTPEGAPLYLRQLPPLPGPEDQTQACRALLAVDDLLGRVETKLTDVDRWDTTYSFWLSDNGMHEGEYRLKKKGAPYRTRIPAYARGPGVTVGSIGELTQNLDIAPTLLELAGGTMAGMKGTSLVPLLTGQTNTLARTELYQEQPVPTQDFPGWVTARTTSSSPHGLLRYTEYTTGERELYDLAADPWQLRNAVGDADKQPAVQALSANVAAFRTS